jgi:hypothetical protein
LESTDDTPPKKAKSDGAPPEPDIKVQNAQLPDALVLVTMQGGGAGSNPICGHLCDQGYFVKNASQDSSHVLAPGTLSMGFGKGRLQKQARVSRGAYGITTLMSYAMGI